METMKECLGRCRWCPLAAVFMGLILLIVGYSVDPENLRKIWLLVSSLIVLCGIVMTIVFNIMSKK